MLPDIDEDAYQQQGTGHPWADHGGVGIWEVIATGYGKVDGTQQPHGNNYDNNGFIHEVSL